MKTVVDVTPTWTALVYWMLEAYRQDGITWDTQKGLEQEFKKMAQAADNWNEHVKNQKERT